VIMYADKITGSMQRTIEETDRRREKQLAYNEAHGITPTQIVKSMESVLGPSNKTNAARYEAGLAASVAADPVVQYMNADQLEKPIARTKKSMAKASKELDFMEAARLRDELFALQE